MRQFFENSMPCTCSALKIHIKSILEDLAFCYPTWKAKIAAHCNVQIDKFDNLLYNQISYPFSILEEPDCAQAST